MARSSNKTPTQIRQEAEASLERARLREAQSLANDNPLVQQVQEYYHSVSSDIAAISRQLNGPQSFDKRRKSFELRLAEIEAGEELANAQDLNLRTVRDYLKQELSVLSKMIADGDEVSQDFVDGILASVPEAVDISGLIDAFESAKNARKQFTESKKTPSKEMEA